MTSISTHVLDTATGRPGVGITVRLLLQDGDNWLSMGGGVTDEDGRINDLARGVDGGVARFVFDTGSHGNAFYPVVEITVRIEPGTGHLHVPLLLSPFGYTTYRGS